MRKNVKDVDIILGEIKRQEDGSVLYGTGGADGRGILFSQDEFYNYMDKREKYTEHINSDKHEDELVKLRTRQLRQRYNWRIYQALFDKDGSPKLPELREIHITREAYEKAKTISDRVVETYGNNEVYLHTLNFLSKLETKDNTIRDIAIPWGQEVTSTACNLRDGPEKRRRTAREIKEDGKYVNGWAHSHGLGSVFHSPKDRSTLDLLPAAGLKSKEIPFTFDEYELEKRKLEVGMIPSLVFNARGSSPNCAIAIKVPYFSDNPVERVKTYIFESPNLKIIDEENNINTNIGDIDKQIEDRIMPLNLSQRVLGRNRKRKKKNLEVTQYEPLETEKDDKMEVYEDCFSVDRFKEISIASFEEVVDLFSGWIETQYNPQIKEIQERQELYLREIEELRDKKQVLEKRVNALENILREKN